MDCIEYSFRDRRFEKVSVSRLIALVPVSRRGINWVVIELDGMGDLHALGLSYSEFSRQLEASKIGISMSWENLFSLAESMSDVYSIAILGTEKSLDELPASRPEESGEFFFELIDNAVWRICAVDRDFLSQIE